LSAAAKPDPALVLTFEPASEPLTALIVGSLVDPVVWSDSKAVWFEG